MAVTKRLRYEVLRRDDHTCQYCGEAAPDVTLHVDHIIPVALGGTDQPGNLVAACKDCNLGKSSVPSDAPLIDGINSRAAAYALDMTDRMTRIRATLELEDEYLTEFEDAWKLWRRDGEHLPLPSDYRSGVYRFARMGVPMRLLERAIETAMTKAGLRGPHGEFQYMAGVIWRTLDETDVAANITPQAVSVYTELEFDDRMSDERMDAYLKGYAKAEQDMKGATDGSRARPDQN